jgi:hypothetical protein
MSPTVFERTEEIRQEFLDAAADLATQIEALATQRQHALRMAHVLAQEANEARRLLEPPPAAQVIAATLPPAPPQPAAEPAVTDAGRPPFRSPDQSVVDRARPQGADPSSGLNALAEVADQQDGEK